MYKIGLQQSAELTALFVTKQFLLEYWKKKDNFLNTVICYARLHIMNRKVQKKKQICMEKSIIYLENEGA